MRQLAPRRLGAQHRDAGERRPARGPALLERRGGEGVVAPATAARAAGAPGTRSGSAPRPGGRRGRRARPPARWSAPAARSRGSRCRTGPGRRSARPPASRPGKSWPLVSICVPTSRRTSPLCTRSSAASSAPRRRTASRSMRSSGTSGEQLRAASPRCARCPGPRASRPRRSVGHSSGTGCSRAAVMAAQARSRWCTVMRASQRGQGATQPQAGQNSVGA